jgi:hypothetical protein
MLITPVLDSDCSPIDLRVLRIYRLDIGRSRSRSRTEFGRGTGLERPVAFPFPLPRIVAFEDAVEELDTTREGRFWISTRSSSVLPETTRRPWWLAYSRRYSPRSAQPPPTRTITRSPFSPTRRTKSLMGASPVLRLR